MEAIGLALAILPLLVSAAEHYADAARCFKRYRKYSAEVESFRLKLSTQKTIFQNEVILLFNAAGVYVDEGIFEHSDRLWDDIEVERKLLAHLGSSKNVWLGILWKMAGLLQDLRRDEKDFGRIIEEPAKPSLCAKEWRKHISARIRFSFSESNLARKLLEISQLNSDIRTLSGQAEHRARLANVKYKSCASLQTSSRKRTHHFELVRKASEGLFDTLKQSCAIHTTHFVHFSLQPIVQEHEAGSVQFELALRPHVEENNPSWLLIRSSNSSGKLNPTEVVGVEMRRSFGQQDDVDVASSFRPGSHEGTSSIVRTQTPGRPVSSRASAPNWNVLDSAGLTTDLLSTTVLGLPNLCESHNFCAMLSSYHEELHLRSGDSCVGFLELPSLTQTEESLKHLVYLSSSNRTKAPKTLASALRDAMFEPDREFSRFQRIRFARFLAQAVLHFHDTPWLMNGNWRSEDICIMINDANERWKPRTLGRPYIGVEVSKQTETPRLRPEHRSDPYIRNHLLFGLALLLIEIAFQRPLDQLQQISPNDQVDSSISAEFMVASKMTWLLGSKISPAYRAIVEKCLWCFPGVGSVDLEDERLRDQYRTDVIDELGRLEARFVSLGLDE